MIPKPAGCPECSPYGGEAGMVPRLVPGDTPEAPRKLIWIACPNCNTPPPPSDETTG
jgi:hypothetical protein